MSQSHGWVTIADDADVRLNDGVPVRLSMRTQENEAFDSNRLLELRNAIEARYNVWIELQLHLADRGEVDGENLIPIRLCEEQPTHRLEVRTPEDAEPQIALVLLTEGVAFTHQEWELGAYADWTYDEEEGWRHLGEVTPGGQPGAVTVQRLLDPHAT